MPVEKVGATMAPKLGSSHLGNSQALGAVTILHCKGRYAELNVDFCNIFYVLLLSGGRYDGSR